MFGHLLTHFGCFWMLHYTLRWGNIIMNQTDGCSIHTRIFLNFNFLFWYFSWFAREKTDRPSSFHSRDNRMIIMSSNTWATYSLSSVLNVTKRLLVVRQLFEKTLFYFMFMNHYSYNWRQVGGRESLDPVSRFNDPEKDSENFWMMRLAPIK